MLGVESIGRRGFAEWGIRSMLATLILVAGGAGVAGTAGYALRMRDVSRAHAFAPWDGRVTALFAASLLSPDSTVADRKRADGLARSALRDDPTAVAAARTLGMNAQIRGEIGVARRLLAYSELLSRRDLLTQFWAIEDAAARNDVEGTLQHYDIALRTSGNAPGLLFPILASAVSDPAIRAALIKTLATEPHWGLGFIDYLAVSGSDLQATASLFTGLQKVNISVSEIAKASIISRLISANAAEDAWSFYTSMRPGVARERSRDPDFDKAIDVPTPFDWEPVQDAGVSATIERDGTDGLFDFAVSPGAGGPMLRQTQMLPVGRYRLRGNSTGIDRPPEARPYWALSCNGGRELGRISIPNSTENGGEFEGVVDVPSECALQTLVLIARPSDMSSGASGQIKHVQLSPFP